MDSEDQEAIRRQQVREASNRALRACKGIPSAACPKIIAMPRTNIGPGEPPGSTAPECPVKKE